MDSKIKSQVGLRAEEMACRYLEKKGYHILERRYHIRGGEIDIIARDGKELVFIEVKARGSRSYDFAVESIQGWKIRRLAKTAEHFLMSRNVNLPSRFDVIGIDFDASGQLFFDHRKAAFDLTYLL